MTREQAIKELSVEYLGDSEKIREAKRMAVEALEQESLTDVLEKIMAEIESCLKALDEIEETKFNIFLPNEMSGRRLTYKQCLGFIDKYKTDMVK